MNAVHLLVITVAVTTPFPSLDGGYEYGFGEKIGCADVEISAV
jgi:hypothetical protein